jgi:hypothetical protein
MGWYDAQKDHSPANSRIVLNFVFSHFILVRVIGGAGAFGVSLVLAGNTPESSHGYMTMSPLHV